MVTMHVKDIMRSGDRFALVSPDCDENKGRAYGFNFVYSGNFLSEVEVDHLNHTRVQIGLGSENFSWLL